MKKLCFLFLIGMMLVCSGYSQGAAEPVLSRIEIEVPSVAQMDQLAEHFEIIGRHGRFLEMIVPQSQLMRVEEIAGFKVRILEQDIYTGLPRSRDEYPTMAELEKKLKKLAQDHGFIQFERYGSSTSGFPLMAIKLSGSAKQKEKKTALLITAATHGDEVITTLVVLAIIDKLVNSYGTDPKITKLINDRELWFIPVLSPDGYSKRRRYVGWTDPNRNFPWPEKPEVSSIPCIAGIRNFYAQKKFVASIDYHAYGQMIMYPWAYTRQAPADDPALNSLTKGMASSNHYRYGQISKVIYVAKGSSCDYFYWKFKSKALAIEVGRSKIPHGAEIDRVIAANMQSALYFLEHAK